MTDSFRTTEELEEQLSRPDRAVIEALSRLDGDILLLGVAGKMGPTLARMARRASDESGTRRRVIGVSRFRDASTRARLEAAGIETLTCDLLDRQAVSNLPAAANVISMSGFKFGASSDPQTAWATNTYLPALVCERFADSRLVVFSTGNVYGLVDASAIGSQVGDALNPVGEYAMAALGRERVVEYFAREYATSTSVLRLNYACECRYGVLLDLALAVHQRQPIDLSMGFVNVVWGSDANGDDTTGARAYRSAGADLESSRAASTRARHCRAIGRGV